MKPMPNLMETELESFGAVKIEDFTWKQLMDTDACTVCGRCTSVCPAHATGKPLDPREIVLKVGEVMAATGDPVVSPPVGVDRDIAISTDSVFERISPEEVWACTSCKACDEICPGQHRDPRQDPRHAALPHADGERLPHRARQHVPLHGELGQRVRHESGRPRRLGRLARRRRHRRARRRVRARVPLLRRLRRQLRRPEQEDVARAGEAAAARGHRLRDPRSERDVQRRPGSPRRQRIHLPDARDAERRDVRRHGREEDHHAVPALFQRA